MYSGPHLKLAVLIGAAVIGAGLVYVNRAQHLIGDTAFMKAMIPHHSIAINNARKAKLRDSWVRDLADGIMQSQLREIAEMEVLLADIAASGTKTGSVVDTPAKMLIGPTVPAPDASAVQVPDGFRVEVALSGLIYPTSVEFDDEGAMYSRIQKY